MLALTGQMAGIAEAAVADAADVARNARRKLESMAPAVSGQAVRTLLDLEEMVLRVGQVIDQTRARLAGDMPDGATRVVSLHDPDARPIRKGRLGKPVEFGYKAQVVDNADGIVLDHHVLMGNPADGPLLVPAVKRIIARVGGVPAAVAADRGYGEARIDAELEQLGVKQVAIPRKGRPSAARQQLQRSARFTKLVKWRTGCEGRIASLKRNAGWDRTLMDGLDGAAIWCGWGILAHNSFKIVALLDRHAAPPHGQARGDDLDRPVTVRPPPRPAPPDPARRPLLPRPNGRERPKSRAGEAETGRAQAHTGDQGHLKQADTSLPNRVFRDEGAAEGAAVAVRTRSAGLARR